jgi:hypothetical protein
MRVVSAYRHLPQFEYAGENSTKWKNEEQQKFCVPNLRRYCVENKFGMGCHGDSEQSKE